MSVVGPRPLLVEYLPLYSEEQKSRHTVRPGLTGQAQIDGRNDLDWADSLAMDVKYTKDIRFTTDLGIVLRTVGKAFIRKEGISQEGVATREAFRGNSEEEQP
jgi:lipopolysaccharide/colanic/teichoic acid biosynthesis glycosyltransferase